MVTPRKESIRSQRKKAVGTAGRGSSVRQADNAVLVKDTRPTAKGSRATMIVSSDFAPAFDAVALCDHVSDVILAAHHDAIGRGSKADGSGPQPPLLGHGAAGKAAKKGHRPNFRGVVTGRFRDGITRFKIKVSGKKLSSGVDGTQAKCTITAPNDRAIFLNKEATENDVEYFYTEGYVDFLIDEAVRQWTDVALDGEAQGDPEERKATQAKAK